MSTTMSIAIRRCEVSAVPWAPFDKATRSELAEFARRIPGSRVERDREDFSVFSNLGSKRVPDENLATIRVYFGELESGP